VGAGPSELLALGARVSKTSPNPLLNERSLELSHGADNLEHEATGRRAQVQVVAEANKGDAIGTEIRESVDQMLEGTAEAIDLPDEHGIEFPPVSVGHELVQFRS
jgi:hypothetical protein